MRKATKLEDAEPAEPAAAAVRFGRLGGLLGYNLTRGHLLSLASFEAAVAGTGLRPSQVAVLLLVEANPGIKQTTLADVLGVDRSTLVRIVDRCESAKLLRRGSSREDRRIAPPLLTAAGRAIVDAIVPKILDHDERAASNLSAAERRTLLRLLQKLNGLGD